MKSDDWLGLKPIASRILVNPAFHRIGRHLLPEHVLHRLPVGAKSVDYLPRNCAPVTLLDPFKDQVAKDIYWGKGRPPSAADRRVLDYIERAAAGAETFLDIGCYSGLFAILAVHANPRLRSVAYEILPENHAMIARNILINRVRAEVKLCGLSDAPGTITMPTNYGSMSHPSSISLSDSFDDGVEIPVTTLDAEGYSGPMLWKIDVEDFEWNVIKGAARTIAENRPNIICEILRSSRHHGEIEALLKPLGYRFLLATDDSFEERPSIVPTADGRDWLFTTSDDYLIETPPSRWAAAAPGGAGAAPMAANFDHRTVEGFGDEWSTFDQSGLRKSEKDHLFRAYFSLFSFDGLEKAEGFDLGCGSGRWAAMVAPKVGTLHCIDPSAKALAVARRNLAGHPNAQFHMAGSDAIPLADDSQDFGFSLGVLHHVPDTQQALGDCVRKLKPGAPFLLYLYYAFDNRPLWFRTIWRGTDFGRRLISRLPFGARKAVTGVIAASVYYPLARTSLLLERLGADVSAIPLNAYRSLSFYTMRTDALDRFGTLLEHRFSKAEIEQMMRKAGLTGIRFSDEQPYWVACGVKAAQDASDTN